jgi:hypothetical protein
MKKTIFTSLVLGAVLLSGCSQMVSESTITEDQKKTPPIKQQNSLDKDNLNKMQSITNDEEKNTTNIELKEYKNEKYKYSFEYPENWYIYDNEFMQGCGPEYGNLGENEIVVSRKKLDSCSAGYLDLAGWIGDILVMVSPKDGYEEEYGNFPESQLFQIGQNLEENARQGVMIPRLKSSEGPRAMATIFFVESSNYNYRIEVKQRNMEGNIDPELMNIINNFLIEE